MAQMGLYHLFLQLTAWCCKCCSVLPEGFNGIGGMGRNFSPFLPSYQSRPRNCALREEQDLLCLEKLCEKTFMLSNFSFTHARGLWGLEISPSGMMIWLPQLWHLVPSYLHSWIWTLAFLSNNLQTWNGIAILFLVLITWGMVKQVVLQTAREKTAKPLTGNRCNKMRSSGHRRKRQEMTFNIRQSVVPLANGIIL